MSNFFRGRGRGGYYNHYKNHNNNQTQTQNSSRAHQNNKQKFQKPPKHAANQLNQYYMNIFVKLKKDQDMRQMTNLGRTYKLIIQALGKYPMPILCAEQTRFLEGVGDVIANRFQELIEQRHKEFEDGCFHIELLKKQGKQISQEAKTFAGLIIPECDLEIIGGLSLKEYLVKRDMQVYRMNKGLDIEEAFQNNDSKKRKFNEISNTQFDIDNGTKKKKLNDTSAFLIEGSVSWSMLLAIFFLALHDDRKSYYITMNSINDMLEVLKNEFSDFQPFETDKQVLDQFAQGDLMKFRENGFIEVQESTANKETLEWKFQMTEKGKNRAKNLCKSAGLQVVLETDLENQNKNKITINMYDKDLMPVVDNLYLIDGTQVQQLKQENGLANRNQVFEPFIQQVEKDMDWLLLSMNSDSFVISNNNTSTYQNSSLSKREDASHSSIINQSLFGDLENLAKDYDEDEEDDDIMMDDQPFDQQQLNTIAEILQSETNSNNTILSNQNQQQTQLASHNTILDQLPNFPTLTINTQKQEQKLLPFVIEKKPAKIQQQQQIVQQPITSEVILYVDNREKKNQRDGNYLFEKLQSTGVNCELKTLPLGDFIWVLRVRNPNNNINIQEEECIENDGDLPQINTTKKKSKKQPNASKKPKGKKQIPQKEYVDYVLDFICERKTADDLAASIMDGRYDEQKFRLKNSDINNVIYLVEGKPSQYCKIPQQVLNKAQIHTQIFHGFNVLRSDTIATTLKWLTDMTRVIKQSINSCKDTDKNFYNKIKDTLIDFKHFSNESGKNSNLDVQHIFSRQLRTIKGLGIDHVQTISRVFKTPYLLYISYKKCGNNERSCLNMLNTGKMELMRNEQMFRQGLNQSEQVIISEEGNATIPKKIDDLDFINLQNVIDSASPQSYNLRMKQFERQFGIKIRKINRNQCEAIYNLFCSKSYTYRSKSKGSFGRKNNKNNNDYEDME